MREEFEAIFKKIEHECSIRDSLSEEILRCYTNTLIYMIARNENLCAPQNEGKHYIEDAVEYIQNNFSSNITLKSIAKKYFVSPEHFSRLFKERTGFNFCEYLNIVRLQKAEAMLKQLNTAHITEVASACGFNDSNYFSLKFKELYGVPPKKFQMMNDRS